jgi:FkbM family methyltransferase
MNTKTYVQIGANVGNDDFYAKVKNLTEPSIIHLIEPNITLHSELLKCYEELSKLHNISVHGYGISNKSEHVCLNLYDNSGLSSIINRKSYSHKTTAIDIVCKSFDVFCEDNQISHIDYLCIDTEGLDYEILNSIDINRINIDVIEFEEWPYENDDDNDNYKTGVTFLQCEVLPKYKNYILDKLIIGDMPSFRLTKKKLSIAFTTFNSSQFIVDALSNIIYNDIVDEIIISDDNSDDITTLKEIINNFNCPKIKLFTHEYHLNASVNKYKAVMYCKNEYVALIDSDNVIDNRYIDLIDFKYDGIQMPSYASPNFDYSSLVGEYDLESIKWLMNSPKRDLTLQCLNTGNYIFPKFRYLEIANNALEFKSYGVDVFYISCLWLHSNYNIKILKGLEYFHRLRPDSLWMKTSNDSNIVMGELINKYL